MKYNASEPLNDISPNISYCRAFILLETVPSTLIRGVGCKASTTEQYYGEYKLAEFVHYKKKQTNFLNFLNLLHKHLMFLKSLKELFN